jgi:hypothetical protein
VAWRDSDKGVQVGGEEMMWVAFIAHFHLGNERRHADP